MKLVLALGSGPTTAVELAARTRQPLPLVRRHLDELATRGTAARSGDHWQLRVSLAEAVSRQFGHSRGGGPELDQPCHPETARRAKETR